MLPGFLKLVLCPYHVKTLMGDEIEERPQVDRIVEKSTIGNCGAS